MTMMMTLQWKNLSNRQIGLANLIITIIQFLLKHRSKWCQFFNVVCHTFTARSTQTQCGFAAAAVFSSEPVLTLTLHIWLASFYSIEWNVHNLSTEKQGLPILGTLYSIELGWCAIKFEVDTNCSCISSKKVRRRNFSRGSDWRRQKFFIFFNYLLLNISKHVKRQSSQERSDANLTIFAKNSSWKFLEIFQINFVYLKGFVLT